VTEEIEEIAEDGSHKESQEKSPTDKMDVDQESQDNTTSVIENFFLCSFFSGKNNYENHQAIQLQKEEDINFQFYQSRRNDKGIHQIFMLINL
jgi:hypothetical protein